MKFFYVKKKSYLCKSNMFFSGKLALFGKYKKS
jgi:hypothetical protein